MKSIIELNSTQFEVFDDDQSTVYNKEAVKGTIQGDYSVIIVFLSGMTEEFALLYTETTPGSGINFGSIEELNQWVVDAIKIANDVVEEAPSDGIQYGRQDGAWTATVTHDDGLLVQNPLQSSISGTALNQENKDIEFVQNIRTIFQLIAEMSVSSAYAVASPTDQIATTTETTLTIEPLAPSTDPTVLEVDGVNDLILIKKLGTYEFVTTLVVENTNTTDRDFIIRTRDTANGDVIVTERTISVDRRATRTLTTIVPAFDTTVVPVDLRVTCQTGGDTLIVRSFQTVLKTVGGSTGGGAIRPINQPVVVTDVTYDLEVNNEANTLLIDDGTDTLTFTTSNLSDSLEYTAKYIIDNRGNTSPINTITWPSEFVYPEYSGFTGIAAGARIMLELEIISATEVFAVFGDI